jgi:hypothetical protein
MKFSLLSLAILLIAVSMQAQTKKIQIAPGLSASIQHVPGSPGVQVLIPGVETIELDLSQPLANSYQIKAADYNFDGHKDFAFVGINAAGGTQIYDIFLYHPADKSYEALEVPGGICERFGNVRLTVADKTLRSSCRSGGKSSMDIFKWVGPYNLELLKSKDNSTDAQQEAAELKAEQKAEKEDVRKDVREEKLDRKKERKEKYDEDDE